GHGGDDAQAAGQPAAIPRLALLAQPAHQTLAQPLGDGNVADRLSEVLIGLALGAGQGVAGGADGQGARERVLAEVVQFAGARTGKFEQVTGGFTIHRSPSGGGGPARPHPGRATANEASPWPGPTVTSRYQSADPSARQCRGN